MNPGPPVNYTVSQSQLLTEQFLQLVELATRHGAGSSSAPPGTSSRNSPTTPTTSANPVESCRTWNCR